LAQQAQGITRCKQFESLESACPLGHEASVMSRVEILHCGGPFGVLGKCYPFLKRPKGPSRGEVQMSLWEGGIPLGGIYHSA
jgi:hypothetical protein